MEAIKGKTVWRVKSGDITRWFYGEVGAREYASDRFDNELDGVPFVTECGLSEALTRLNELELGRATFMGSYDKKIA